MFALALWDGRTRTLLAARDRAGEKPLYWTQTPRGLLLASEVKALLVRPEVSRELDPIAVDQFLTYEYVLAPRTILKGVHKLPPAHFLTYRDGEVTVHRYWDAADVPLRDMERRRRGRGAAGGAAARDGRAQMMADVPLGAFLSGGIDSSTIVAFMSEASLAAGQQLQHRLRRTAPTTSCRTRAKWRRCSRPIIASGTVSPDLDELFERLIVHLDEPFADVSLFPTFSVSQLAREHVKVVLSGDGGDELFGGYDAYQAQELAARLGWMGDALMPALAGGRRGAAADGEEEGPGQQVQALQRRRRARARGSRSLPLDGVSRARATRRVSTAPACATRSARSTSTRRCATRSAASARTICSTGSSTPTCASIWPTTSS